jgi:hypothetical protein
MIKSHEKKYEFKKKRFRNEKRAHEDRKRKRNKKIIHESIIPKSTMSFSKIISDEFSLSSTRTIATSSFASLHNDRARQLSNELKKVHRQYQAERMTELIQLRRSTINEMLRYEYDFNILKHLIQIVISFTFINV